MALKCADITKEALISALKACGLVKGDSVLVHSDIFLMGPLKCRREAYLSTYYEAFFDVLGKEGTLIVPAFFYEYARSQTPYDVKNSPVSSELGVFTRYVMTKPGVLRSLNPIAALAAVGARAEHICCGGTGSSFGVDSPWDRLLKSNGKIVFVGIDLRAMTFVHYVEYMVGVPHLYNKFYTTPVSHDGENVDIPISGQVRYLDFKVEYDLENFTPKFENAGLVKAVKVGRATMRCVSAREIFNFLVEKLKQNYFCLLKHPPKFIDGKIPTDGTVGKIK